MPHTSKLWNFVNITGTLWEQIFDRVAHGLKSTDQEFVQDMSDSKEYLNVRKNRNVTVCILHTTMYEYTFLIEWHKDLYQRKVAAWDGIHSEFAQCKSSLTKKNIWMLRKIEGLQCVFYTQKCGIFSSNIRKYGRDHVLSYLRGKNSS